MAEATVAALERWPSGEALIVADDEPVRWRELFGFVAAATGTAESEPGGFLGFPSFRLSNQRSKAVLDWAPSYPNYRLGLAR
jgi:nucleoside-diphosphate-sugar epimerase